MSSDLLTLTSAVSHYGQRMRDLVVMANLFTVPSSDTVTLTIRHLSCDLYDTMSRHLGKNEARLLAPHVFALCLNNAFREAARFMHSRAIVVK